MGLFDNLFGKKEEFFLELGESKAPAEAPKAEAPAAAAAPAPAAPVAAKPAAAAPAAKAETPAPAAAKPAAEAPLAPPVEAVNFATEYVGVAGRTPRRRPGVAMAEFLELAQSVGRR